MSIQNYLDILSNDIIELDLSDRNLTELPNLIRFYKLTRLNISMNKLKELVTLPSTLKILDCSNNNITKISSLPPVLKIFDCRFNKLKELIELPPILEILDCSYNEITHIPLLPSRLKIFECAYNNIIKLPRIPYNLSKLICNDNQLIILPLIPKHLDIFNYDSNPIYDLIDSDDIDIINKRCNIIYRFIFSCYVFKYRKQFKNFYYKRIVEPRVIRRSNPSNLLRLIEDNSNKNIIEIIDNFENFIDIV